MIHIYILCKSECLTGPRTGDIGPDSWSYFVESQDFQSSSPAVNVLFVIYLFSQVFRVNFGQIQYHHVFRIF